MANRATNLHGCPLPSVTASMTVGQQGNILLQDTNLVEHLAQFDRERIPERVVHAKGGAAFGYFQVTDDISAYTKATVFSEIGKITQLAVRFSTVGGESGSADSVRDPRGFAVKMYTEDGNWDLVGNNTPIFFIRDPILFPSFIHTQKRNPRTHLKDPNMMWDFISLRPETLNQVCFLFSDRGTPDGFRHMDGFGSHTFKLINARGEPCYCKFHWITDQGLKNLTPEEAGRLAGSNPDYAIQDLYEAIARGEFPSWTLYVQIMTFEEAENYRWNPFDVTKRWLVSDVPLQKVGTMVLNRNPQNYFADVEQIAFCPANMIPGIEASPDKMLQGRMFSYVDTQRHRLGTNFPQLPVNKPLTAPRTYTRDGPMCYDNQLGAPNYFPNSLNGPGIDPGAVQSSFPLTGDVVRHDSGDEDNFSQVNVFWLEELLPDERQRMVNNIAASLRLAIQPTQNRVLANIRQVNAQFGSMLELALQGKEEKEKEKVAKKRKCTSSKH